MVTPLTIFGTQILSVSTAPGVLQTSVQPAFWMRPGEQHADPTPACSQAVNTEVPLMADYGSTDRPSTVRWH
jgi:hypothetical protein